jgi:hypothetical protein
MHGNYGAVIFSNPADFTALGSFTAEASLLAGQNTQPILPAGILLGPGARGSILRCHASGVLGSTGTPTYTFSWRIGSTAAAVSGTAVAVSAAITTASGVSNKLWVATLDLIVNTEGIGSGNLTLSGCGFIQSPGGFASPFAYAMAPGAGESATWTSTIDGAVQNYIQLSVACSASSSSNAITCKKLIVEHIG